MEEIEVLKKASAEILLNMAKESAARVMLSERKVLGLEHQLRCTRDEGVRLLVRMNNMIDSTIDEARSTSLNHQRKIDELEAQLQEGEDKITDLREELYWMQDKLEKMKKDQVTNNDETPGKSRIILSPSSPLELKTMRVSEKKHKTLNPSISDSNCRKGNGCTTRIPTSERNSPGSKNMEMKQHLFQKVGRISRSRILRKRKPHQYGKVKANSSNSCSKKILKPCIRTECKAVEGNSNILMDNMQHGRILDELIINNRDSISCSTAMNPDSLSKSCQQYSSLIESKGYSFSMEANPDFSKHQSENEVRVRPLTNLDPELTKSECSRNLTVSIKASKTCGTYRYPLKNDDSKDDPLVKRGEAFLANPLPRDQATTDGEFLQYKRKRKKESMSCPYEIASPENTDTKRLLPRLRNVCC